MFRNGPACWRSSGRTYVTQSAQRKDDKVGSQAENMEGISSQYSIISADQKPDNIFDSGEFKDREMSAGISHHGIFDFIWISKKSPPSKSGHKTKITSVLRFPGKPVKITGPGPGAEDSRLYE